MTDKLIEALERLHDEVTGLSHPWVGTAAVGAIINKHIAAHRSQQEAQAASDNQAFEKGYAQGRADQQQIQEARSQQEAAQEPVGYCVFGIKENVALLDYAGHSENVVRSRVWDVAYREGFRGRVDDRMRQLGWEIRPVFGTSPAPSESAARKPLTDEREAFEAWAGREYRNAPQYTRRDYELGRAAWQARAAMAASGGESDAGREGK